MRTNGGLPAPAPVMITPAVPSVPAATKTPSGGETQKLSALDSTPALASEQRTSTTVAQAMGIPPMVRVFTRCPGRRQLHFVDVEGGLRGAGRALPSHAGDPLTGGAEG